MDGAGGNRCHRRADDGAASPSSSLQIRSFNLPTVAAMYGPQGWADLPDALLHSIASLLLSFPDILAFAATCPSWRAAFASYPSKSSFSLLLPPLLLQPDVPLCSPCPRPYSRNLMPRCPCYVTNLASPNMHMCCQIPLFRDCAKGNVLPSHPDNFRFIGASYGHLILSNKQVCVVVDVFTGVSVSPPQLPVNKDNQLYNGILTAPLASPNSHLMVTIESHIFLWRVGSHSWVRCSNLDSFVYRVVVFKGQVFGMHSISELFIVHLVPRIRLQEIAVDLGKRLGGLEDAHMWLVECGDMLLMVRSPSSFLSIGNTWEAFRLDLSVQLAKWVKVEKLENWAIFISIDRRSQTFCCMDPGRWGGRSNCIYYYDSKEWVTCELGKPLQGGASSPGFECDNMLQPMWVVPSMFYPCL
ncbi:hypothetical protein ACQ4PT_062257 [Festuca glaucescens]